MRIRYLGKIKLLFILLYLTGCASFSPLPYDFKASSNINGIYHNDPYINPFGDHKLWDHIHSKSSVPKDSLYVSFAFIEKNRLHAELLDGEKIIAEKDLKIKLGNDSCYYSKRFFVIPILPIIWAYSNEQKRFVIGEKSLILERTSNSGGAMIFMAGGDKYNDSWEYEKKNNSR